MIRTLLQTLVLLLVVPHLSKAGQAGIPAPSFALTDTQGDTISLDSLRGKVVFLNFWAPWCASCKEEFPALDTLFKKYKSNGVVIIGICVDGSEKAVAEFLRKTPVSFPIAIDKSGDAAEAYRCSGLPAGFVIGRDGVIRHMHRGFGKEYVPMFEKEIADLVRQH